MVLTKTPICNFKEKAHDFYLKGVDNKFYKLQDCVGSNGTLIMFICNHCPYVKAVIEKIVITSKELKKYEINSLAVMPNDVINYPEDSFENMQKFSKNFNFDFPYLLDETQEVSKLYGAVCTPDFFGYNKDLELQYRGRLDNSGISGEPLKEKELLKAFDQIINEGKGPKEQKASMGCSIKWK